MAQPVMHAARRRARPGFVGIVAVAAALLVRPASASPLFELVGDGQGTGGFNARVTGASAASAYFNPALLPFADKGFDLGEFFLDSDIGITLDARDGPSCPNGACDVPERFGGGPEAFRHADGTPIANPALPTSWLQNGRPTTAQDPGFPARPRQGAGTGHQLLAYQTIGLVTPIFGQRAVLGFYAMIPLSKFTTARAFYNDEREQYFSNSLHPELYSDRLTATSLAFGGGGRVTHKLSVGFTFTLNLVNSAAAPVYVSNLSDLNTVQLDSDIGVEASVAPHFGVVYDVRPDLRLTATVHTQQAFKIKTGFDYILSTGTQQGAEVNFTHAYMPLTFGTGASWDLGDVGGHHLAAVGSATYARWSQYVDRHSERPVADYAWSDTIGGAVGMRDSHGAATMFLDVSYQPSPVPAQTGRSNYVDNDRVGLNGGAEVRFALWGTKFRAGVQLEGHRLIARHVTKFIPPINPQPNPNQPGFGANDYPSLVKDEVPDDAVDGTLGQPIPGRTGLQTNNPGFPGFGSEGWIVGGSLHIAVLY